MYRPDAIQTALLNLIGWRQNYNTEEFSIASSLTSTSSGVYFQDFHPMLTLDNLKAVAPDFSRVTFDVWNGATQYYAGDRVTLTDNEYRAKIASSGLSPDSNPAAWELFDGFSEWLEQKTKAAIGKVVRRFWTEKMEEKTARNIIESKALFDGAGRLSDVITEAGNWAGFEIVPLRAQGVTLELNKIGLQFTGTGTVTLYLLHSSQKAVQKTIECEITREDSFHWFSQEDLLTPYIGTETEAGGSWFLIYDQNALPEGMKAINKERDWSKDPCNSCNDYDTRIWNTFSKFLEIHPFKIEAGDTVELWDIADNLYTYSRNYGINLQLSLSCDVSDLIIQYKKTFQNAIGLQMAESMLQEFLYNPNFRIGRTQQGTSNQELRYELDGAPQSFKKSGISYELTKAVNALKIDTTAMSRICTPCNNGGVKYRTV